MTISSSPNVEVNLVRLLGRCEAMASGSNEVDWRLTKYIEKLNEYLAYLRKLSANAPAPELLSDYGRRVELLKSIVAAKTLPNSVEKSQATDLLTSSKPSSVTTSSSRDLHNKTKARYHKDARDELLNESQLRQRGAGTADAVQDVDMLLRHHRQQQERLAEDMVHLARSLKENARTAGRIVRDDKEKLVETARLAESNFGHLKVESGRLAHHANKGCSWWILLVLILVIAVFVWMVLFMKMFKKK